MLFVHPPLAVGAGKMQDVLLFHVMNMNLTSKIPADGITRSLEASASKVSRPAKSGCIRRASIVTAAVLLFAVFFAPAAWSQNEIKSADLTKQWQSIVENMGAAQAADQQANAKATDLLSAAEAAKARANDTNLPPQTRFENHAAYLGFETKAAQAQLDAARQNTKYLTAAAAALGAVRKDLQIESPQYDPTPVIPVDQHPVDSGMTPFKYSAGDGVDVETAQELREARQFYQAVSEHSTGGMDGMALCRRLGRRLGGWQARNRRHLVMADSALRRLELSAVSGLAGVINYGLDQENTNLSTLAFSMDLAPEMSGGSGASPSSPSADKVPLNDVLGGH